VDSRRRCSAVGHVSDSVLRKRTSVIFTASALAVFGTMFEGIRLVFTGYAAANIDSAPGISLGGEYTGITTDIWATAGVYTPTLVEVAVTSVSSPSALSSSPSA